MDEYLSKTKLLKLIESRIKYAHEFNEVDEQLWTNALHEFCDLPSENVVPAVRCKDCEFCKDSYCSNTHYYGHSFVTQLDHYCSKGTKRKLDETSVPSNCNWKLLPNGDGICKICNKLSKHVWDVDGWQNYCGNCGSDMRSVASDDRQHGKLEIKLKLSGYFISEFTIDGEDADLYDFGGCYDASLETAPDYGCGNRVFRASKCAASVLSKYNISEMQYYKICEELEQKLHIGQCNWCA